jgi:hypothetical protein
MKFFEPLFRRAPEKIIPGTQITLGTKVYIIAPLNFATLKLITPLLSSFNTLGKTPTVQDFDNMVQVIWLALKRNHPHIALKEVEEGLDLSNIHSITAKTMLSGGAAPAGEAPASA